MTPERWQHIKEILQRALEQAPEKRPDFVAQACPGDASLQKEVESLLAARQESLDSPTLPVLEEGLDSVMGRPIGPYEGKPMYGEVAIGQTLAHYRIESKLGEGGMGVVYRALDTKLGREVALKLLRQDLAGDQELMARFRREAHILALLNHPNIAAIHGLEEVNGATLLVLELVEGETLAERLKKKPMALREGMDVCRQIAEALEAIRGHLQSLLDQIGQFERFRRARHFC